MTVPNFLCIELQTYKMMIKFRSEKYETKEDEHNHRLIIYIQTYKSYIFTYIGKNT